MAVASLCDSGGGWPNYLGLTSQAIAVLPLCGSHADALIATAMKYAVIYEKSSTGYGAYLPDLPGCIAAGGTLEETAQLIKEAVQMHLEAMRRDGEIIPQPTTLADYIIV